LPEPLAMISERRLTPTPSLVLFGALSVAMLVVSNIETLLNYYGFAQTMVFGVTVAGLLALRFTEPDRERPIKVLSISSNISTLGHYLCVIVILPNYSNSK
jgi:L-type amino acid transporter 6